MCACYHAFISTPQVLHPGLAVPRDYSVLHCRRIVSQQAEPSYTHHNLGGTARSLSMHTLCVTNLHAAHRSSTG